MTGKSTRPRGKQTSTRGTRASTAGKKAAATRTRPPSSSQKKTAEEAAAGQAQPEGVPEEQAPVIGVLIQIQRTDEIGNFAIAGVTPLGGVLPAEVPTVCEMGVKDYRSKLGLPTAR